MLKLHKIGGTDGCEVYCWFDDPTTPFVRRLIVDLRNVVWEKSEENMRLMEDLGKERFEKTEKQKL